MTTPEEALNVVRLPKTGPRKPSSTERIWGKAVMAHGYTGIPSILVEGQSRLGITPLQMNIVVQLLNYWRDPDRRPFPTKKDIADRIGVTRKPSRVTFASSRWPGRSAASCGGPLLATGTATFTTWTVW